MATRAHRHNLRREESPSHTEGIQDEYRREVERRLRQLRGAIRQTIAENDALELGNRQNQEGPEEPPEIKAREEFEFTTAKGKQNRFMEQLREWLQQAVLVRMGRSAVAAGEHYTGVYVRSAYERGIEFANTQLDNIGMDVEEEDLQSIMRRPIHQDTLETIYTRNYQALKDITEDIDESLSRILGKGLVEGWNPRKTADKLTEEIRDIQKSRARAMARTETMHAHNTAAAKRYEEQGVSEAKILTHDPCPQCQRIEARDPYPVEEAKGILPAHPNCICTWAPVLGPG